MKSTVDLSFQSLTMLTPESLSGHAEVIDTLILSDNQLRALPVVLGDLYRLRVLEVERNELTELPAFLGELIGLRSLLVSGNRLERLPPEIGRLAELTALRATDNQLETLPESIAMLDELQTLRLARNRFTTLPAELGRLRALRELDLAGNQIGTVPPEAAAVRTLRTLDLSQNHVTELPEQLVGLHALRSINLSRNLLTAFPACLLELPDLKLIDLRHNAIRELPAALAGLYERGVEIRLDGNPVRPVFARCLGRVTDPQARAEASGVLRALGAMRRVLVTAVLAADLTAPGDTVSSSVLADDAVPPDLAGVATIQRIGVGPRFEILHDFVCPGPDQLHVIIRADAERAELERCEALLRRAHDARLRVAVVSSEFEAVRAALAAAPVADVSPACLTALDSLVSSARQRAWLARGDFERECDRWRLSTGDQESAAALLGSAGFIRVGSGPAFEHYVLDPAPCADALLAAADGVMPETVPFSLDELAGLILPGFPPSVVGLVAEHLVGWGLLRHAADGLFTGALTRQPTGYPWRATGPVDRRAAVHYRLGEPVSGVLGILGALPPAGTAADLWADGLSLVDERSGIARSEALVAQHGAEVSVSFGAATAPAFRASVEGHVGATLRCRWPGIDLARFVSCSGRLPGDGRCPVVFDAAELERDVDRQVSDFTCEKCGTRVSPLVLLAGIGSGGLPDAVKAGFDDLGRKVGRLEKTFETRIGDLLAAVDAQGLTHPRLIVLRERPRSKFLPKSLYAVPMELLLCCEWSDGVHEVAEARYRFSESRDWVTRVQPYVKYVEAVLKLVRAMTPAAGALGLVTPASAEKTGHLLDRAATVVHKTEAAIPGESGLSIGAQPEVVRQVGAGYRLLGALLGRLDPDGAFGGMDCVRVAPTGAQSAHSHGWLCAEHVRQMNAGS